jgi:hypothetical protein
MEHLTFTVFSEYQIFEKVLFFYLRKYFLTLYLFIYFIIQRTPFKIGLFSKKAAEF